MRLTTAVVLFLAVSGFAQQQTAPPPLTQKIEVNVVNVDVTVLDSRGNPVTDLTKDDFEVREDGVPQQITNFSLIKGEKLVAKPEQPQQQAFASDSEMRRSVVVLVDVRAMGEKPQRARAVDALKKMLAQYPDDSKWSVVVLRSGLRSMLTIVPLTDDRAKINEAFVAMQSGLSLPGSGEAAIQRVKAVGYEGNSGPLSDVRAAVDVANAMDQAVSFFSAIIQTARGLEWLPGKKVMLIVSSAVPGYVRPGTQNAEALALMHEKMVEETNSAGANIFVIDPLGVSATLNMGGGNENYIAAESNRETSGGQRNIGGAAWLSQNTGGLYLPSNDMHQSLDKLQRATTNYYELAYHAPGADEKYHHITVTLKRPGRYTVTHRQGYLRLSKDEGFARAMASPLGIASQKPTLPVQLTLDEPKPAADGTNFNVPFRASVPVKLLQILDGKARAHVYVSLFDKDGQLVRMVHFVETMNGVTPSDERTLDVSRALALPKGKYRVFVAMRDELTDQVGIATKEIAF